MLTLWELRARLREALPWRFARRMLLVGLAIGGLSALAASMAIPIPHPVTSSFTSSLVRSLAVVLVTSVLLGGSAVGLYAATLLGGETWTVVALAPFSPAARTRHLLAPALVLGALPLAGLYAPLLVFTARIDMGLAAAGAFFGCLGIVAGPSVALIETVVLVRALGRERGAAATRAASALLGVSVALGVRAALRSPPLIIVPAAIALLGLLGFVALWAIRSFPTLLQVPMRARTALEPAWGRSLGWRLARRGGAFWSAGASAIMAAYSLVQPSARAILLACGGLTAVLSILGRVFADDAQCSLRWRLAPAGPSVRREMLVGVGLPTALLSWAVAYELGPRSAEWSLALGALLFAAIGSFQVPPGFARRVVHIALLVLAAASGRLA